MEQENEYVKNISLEMEQKRYVIHNVPVKVYEAYSKNGFYDSDVTVKLLLLKDLMESDEIPSEIDFQKAKDINIE